MSTSPELTVRAKGQDWQVVPPRGVDKKELGRWLRSRFRDELEEARAKIGEELYQTQFSIHFNACTSGVFDWRGVVCQMALGNKGGDARLHLLLLLLQRNHSLVKSPDGENPAAEIYDDNPAEFDKALDYVLNPSPNSPSPVTPGTTA